MEPGKAESDVIGAVRRAIEAYLPEGHPAIHSVADKIGINARTLQRRLAGRDLTYRKLVDDVRLKTACELLARGGMSLSDISRALGYSDPAHFTRAFGRLTGMTPRRYQARARKGTAD